MYKTVRQGDNSLQYTILAQDDYTATAGMKRRRSTRRNTAFVLIVTLILGCGIVAAAVLIPVLLSSNVVPIPARFQTFAVAASKYNIQGTQYIALLPIKDATGHFNGFQLRPTVTTTTTTERPTTKVTILDRITNSVNVSTRAFNDHRIVDMVTPGYAEKRVTAESSLRIKNNDPERPNNHSVSLNSPSTTHNTTWLKQHSSTRTILAGIAAGLMLTSVWLLVRHRHRKHLPIAEPSTESSESDKVTLLAEISGEED